MMGLPLGTPEPQLGAFRPLRRAGARVPRMFAGHYVLVQPSLSRRRAARNRRAVREAEPTRTARPFRGVRELVSPAGFGPRPGGPLPPARQQRQPRGGTGRTATPYRAPFRGAGETILPAGSGALPASPCPAVAWPDALHHPVGCSTTCDGGQSPRPGGQASTACGCERIHEVSGPSFFSPKVDHARNACTPRPSSADCGDTRRNPTTLSRSRLPQYLPANLGSATGPCQGLFYSLRRNRRWSTWSRRTAPIDLASGYRDRHGLRRRDRVAHTRARRHAAVASSRPRRAIGSSGASSASHVAHGRAELGFQESPCCTELAESAQKAACGNRSTRPASLALASGTAPPDDAAECRSG
jgi:hypothetical protein